MYLVSKKKYLKALMEYMGYGNDDGVISADELVWLFNDVANDLWIFQEDR